MACFKFLCWVTGAWDFSHCSLFFLFFFKRRNSFFFFFLLRLALSIYSCLFSDSFEPWYESCHLHAYTFTLYVRKNTMRCAILNLCVNFHNGSKTWADIFFKNVNLEYNKYKLRTAFDETKRPSHLCTLCRCCDSTDVCVQLASKKRLQLLGL